MNNDYGLCDVCQIPLQTNTFINKEFYPNSNTLTGRTRFAVNFLYCPCCGSGSHLLAAKQCGRKYLGIELDDTWFETAKSRIETS